MAKQREPTQAMPPAGEQKAGPSATQPTEDPPRKTSKAKGEGFGGFMGHGGQSDITHEGPEEDGEGDNPNAVAKPE